MQTNHQKYAVRSGTLDSGKEYEYKMVALLSLRCFLEDPEDLWIVSNADSVGAFDDIILYIRKKGKEGSTYMLQLKHTDKSKNITEDQLLSPKGDFSLNKYSNDLIKLKQSCESKKSGIISNLGYYEKITFALFTNRGVLTDYDCLSKICEGNHLSILNTNGNSFDLCKFNLIINNNLYLIANQIHVQDLEEAICKEIKKIVDKFKITHVNVKLVTEKFIKHIFEWYKGNLGGHYYLTKQDVYCKLTELFFIQYELDFNQDQYDFYEDAKLNIWNTITSNKHVTIIIEPDEDILKFLKLYIGSEVKKYLLDQDVAKLWVDNVPEQLQTSFYQQNDLDVKIQMLKIIGNHGKITLKDIYKCLWLTRKLPLVLQANNEEETENIMKILKLSGSNQNVIIVNRTQVALHARDDFFLTLKDVQIEERDVILDQAIQLQGRPSIILKELINEDIFEEIKCKDIINILKGNFNVGNKYKPVSGCFIERTLSRVYIKPEVFKNLQDDFFLIENPNDFEEVNNNIIIRNEKYEEEINKLKSEGKVIHRLIGLEWKETFGSLENIRRYQLEDEDVDEEEISVEDLVKDEKIFNSACIISANPGMGKSTLLDYIATQTSPDKWMIKVNLTDHHDYYEDIKQKKLNYRALDHLKYFFQKLNQSKLTKMVFEKLLKSKSIFILLDGFDEISISCKEEVTQIAKCLQEEGYKIWITTRPVMKSYLEKKLNTFSITIHAFTKFDQVAFLTKYFLEIIESPEEELIIASFALALLQAVQVNLNDYYSSLKFMGIPLQTMLIADVFSNELKTFLKTGTINLDQNFDLVYLYQEFIKRKNKILCEKFGIGSKDMRKVFEEPQQLFALRYIFDFMQEFKIYKQLKGYYETNLEKFQFLQLEGVLVVEETSESFTISFIHRTFAEYLAAQWISQNLNNSDVDIKIVIKRILKKRLRSSDRHSFLFKIFDCLISKNSEPHLAIIHDRIGDLKRMLEQNPDTINRIDDGGRTVLHMLSIYSNQSGLFGFEINDDDGIMEMIAKLPNNKIKNLKDNLGYTPLDYAIICWNMGIANKICEKSQFSKIGIKTHFQYRYFEICAKHNFKELFKVLLLYFASDKILSWSFGKDLTIELFCKHSDLSKEHLETLIGFAKDFGVTTLWDLFQFETLNDLRFTAAFGTKDLLRFLLSKGANIHERDIFNNTPLHYSVRHERLDMVKFLISRGADVDTPGNNGNTPIHDAAKRDYPDIINLLLSKGADINKQNNSGSTPLHVAITSFDQEIAELLLKKGAEINLKDVEGKLPLHYATEYGLEKIASKLILKNNESVNFQSNNGKSPLHSLMNFLLAYNEEQMHSYEKILYSLLKSGADLNIQDNNGNTPLHYICRDDFLKGRNTEYYEASKTLSRYVFGFLLNKGADVTLKNKEGKTVWDSATASNQVDLIALLERHLNRHLVIIEYEENNQEPTSEQSNQNCVLL